MRYLLSNLTLGIFDIFIISIMLRCRVPILFMLNVSCEIHVKSVIRPKRVRNS